MNSEVTMRSGDPKKGGWRSILAFERGGRGRNTLLDPRKCTFNLGVGGGGGLGGQGSSRTPSKSLPSGSMTRFRAGDKIRSGPQVGQLGT